MTAKQTKPTQDRRTGEDSRTDTAGSKMQEKAQAMQADAKRQAETVKESVKEGVNRVVSEDVQREVQQKVGAATQDIRHDLHNMGQDMQAQAAELAETRKSEAAQRLGGVASAIREAGHSFEEREEATLAYYTNSLAEQIDSFSHNLREREIGALVDDARQLAHRQPEMFVTGALALGFLVGRFFKSSSASSRYQDRYQDRYDEQNYNDHNADRYEERGRGYGNRMYRREYENSSYQNRGYANRFDDSRGRYGTEGRYADYNAPYRAAPGAPVDTQAYGSTYNDPQRSFGNQYQGLNQEESTGNGKANSRPQSSQPQQGKADASAENPTGHARGSQSQE